jgi:hypothetical protein
MEAGLGSKVGPGLRNAQEEAFNAKQALDDASGRQDEVPGHHQTGRVEPLEDCFHTKGNHGQHRSLSGAASGWLAIYEPSIRSLDHA